MQGILTAARSSNKDEEIIGVGIQLNQEPKTKLLVVVNTITGTSAASSGILPKDVITKIDNLSTNGMSLEQAIKLIRGSVGTEVTLGILRDRQPLEFTLKRTRVVVQRK
ncbi:MAG: PDZ domain-containing protein [Pseudanabaena sp. CRU_2_10]|nr:PDZ domain-containing protein [Pseudanabaena sp. CRU_2_10]